MAPFDELEKRQYPRCPYGQYPSNGGCYEYSAWYWWGRWVLAGIVVFCFIFFLVCLGCISSRRRRKRGLQPMYGTGWMTNGNKYNNAYPQNGYQGYNQNQGYANPPPAYNAPVQNQQYTGTTFNPNDGYYGGHNDVPLQQPQNVYSRDVYSPPAGPPPGK